MNFALQIPLPLCGRHSSNPDTRLSETLPHPPAAGREVDSHGTFHGPGMTHPTTPMWFRLTLTDMLSSSFTLILWGRYLSSSFSDDEPEGQTRYVTSSRSPVAAWQLRDAPTPTPRSAWHRAGGVGGASRLCRGDGWSAHPSGIDQAYI